MAKVAIKIKTFPRHSFLNSQISEHIYIIRNDKQWTPMDCAAHNGHEKLIKLLIDCDAPIDAKDRSLASVSMCFMCL